MPQTLSILLDFNADKPASPPRDAATVIVLRDSDQGLQVFCVRRHARSGFMGGAVVFPGGKVDDADAADGWRTLATEPHPRAAEFATATLAARTLAVAACRETLEEGGIVPALGADPLSAEELNKLRNEHRTGVRQLADALAHRRLRLAIDALVPWSRWVTPTAEPRRFDARFFLLALPDGQVGSHDEHETIMSFWATPGEVLDKFLRGDIFLAPPTIRSLELLAAADGVEGAFELAATQPLSPICPRFMPGEGGAAPYLALPGDPSHEAPERRIAGPTRFVLENGIFVSREASAIAEGSMHRRESPAGVRTDR